MAKSHATTRHEAERSQPGPRARSKRSAGKSRMGATSTYPKNMFFTSESVTEGHPDKVCDQVSDAVLDECLRQDPRSRVACNTFVTLGMMIVGAEITTRAMFAVDALARKLGNEIGYTSPLYGYDVNTGAIRFA